MEVQPPETTVHLCPPCGARFKVAHRQEDLGVIWVIVRHTANSTQACLYPRLAATIERLQCPVCGSPEVVPFPSHQELSRLLIEEGRHQAPRLRGPLHPCLRGEGSSR